MFHSKIYYFCIFWASATFFGRVKVFLITLPSFFDEFFSFDILFKQLYFNYSNMLLLPYWTSACNMSYSYPSKSTLTIYVSISEFRNVFHIASCSCYFILDVNIFSWRKQVKYLFLNFCSLYNDHTKTVSDGLRLVPCLVFWSNFKGLLLVSFVRKLKLVCHFVVAYLIYNILPVYFAFKAWVWMQIYELG